MVQIVVRASCLAPLNYDPRSSVARKTYHYNIINSNIRHVIGAHHQYHVGGSVALNIDRMRMAASRLVGRHDFTTFCGNKHAKRDSIKTATATSDHHVDEKKASANDNDSLHRGNVRTLSRCDIIVVDDGTSHVNRVRQFLSSSSSDVPSKTDNSSTTELTSSLSSTVEETALSSCYHRHIRIELEGDGFLYQMCRIIVGTLIAAGAPITIPSKSISEPAAVTSSVASTSQLRKERSKLKYAAKHGGIPVSNNTKASISAANTADTTSSSSSLPIVMLRDDNVHEWMDTILASRDRARAAPTAPAMGLTLFDVNVK
jgi:tRNA U38,U39,U40 pseudouridine synthase TruA